MDKVPIPFVFFCGQKCPVVPASFVGKTVIAPNCKFSVLSCQRAVGLIYVDLYWDPVSVSLSMHLLATITVSRLCSFKIESYIKSHTLVLKITSSSIVLAVLGSP